jgi:hypothetical protein
MRNERGLYARHGLSFESPPQPIVGFWTHEGSKSMILEGRICGEISRCRIVWDPACGFAV